MLGLFATKFTVGVLVARSPALRQVEAFAGTAGLAYGAFSGLFLGRALALGRAGPAGGRDGRVGGMKGNATAPATAAAAPADGAGRRLAAPAPRASGAARRADAARLHRRRPALFADRPRRQLVAGQLGLLDGHRHLLLAVHRRRAQLLAALASRLRGQRVDAGDGARLAWLLASIAVGAPAGYALGHRLAAGLLGHDPRALTHDWPTLAVTLIAALAASLWFRSSERLRDARLAAESARRIAAEHELKLLASQLEPHMLFNTLANLRVLIALDPPRAQAMLDRLIAFLRAMLGASRVDAHPLAAEFARLGDYLELMQVRMGGRLRSTLRLPAELQGVPVPPFLLQPLVENAIRHGLEPQVGGGRIEVSAAREGAQLVLRVRDTGVGLAAAPAAGADDGAAGFGLTQVRERLASRHGAAASLQLAAAGDAEGGVLATVRLPLDAAGPR